MTPNFFPLRGWLGPVTNQMVSMRANELAANDGRNRSSPTPADYEQARRELTGSSTPPMPFSSTGPSLEISHR